MGHLDTALQYLRQREAERLAQAAPCETSEQSEESPADAAGPASVCLVSGCGAGVIAWVTAAGEGVGVCRGHGLQGHLLAEAAALGDSERAAAWPVAQSGDEAGGRALLTALVACRMALRRDEPSTAAVARCKAERKPEPW